MRFWIDIEIIFSKKKKADEPDKKELPSAIGFELSKEEEDDE